MPDLLYISHWGGGPRESYYVRWHPSSKKLTRITPLLFDRLDRIGDVDKRSHYQIVRVSSEEEFKLRGRVAFEWAQDSPPGSLPRLWHIVVNDWIVQTRVNTWQTSEGLGKEIAMMTEEISRLHPSIVWDDQQSEEES